MGFVANCVYLFHWAGGLGPPWHVIPAVAPLPIPKPVDNIIFSALSLLAFGLLLAVSGGILYLTVAEWRDRRRRERDRRESGRP